MSKINDEGVNQILLIKNALNSIYEKIGEDKTFPKISEEMKFIADFVDSVEHEWERV